MKLSFKQSVQTIKNTVNRLKPNRETARNLAERVCPQTPQYDVKFVVNKGGVVDSEITGAIVENMSKLKELANAHRTDIKITQYGDRVALNTGAVTEYVDKAKIRDAESLYGAVADTIGSNKNKTDALLKSTMII